MTDRRLKEAARLDQPVAVTGRRAEGFGIRRKKIVINNDIIPRQLDVFSV